MRVKMEKARRGGENNFRNKLMSSNDHVRNWFLREKRMKENAFMQDSHQLKQNRKEERNNFIESLNHSETRKSSKPGREKRQEKKKFLRNDLINFELKRWKKSKANKEPQHESQTEMERCQKYPEENKTKEQTVFDQEVSWPNRKLSSFHNTWEYTNYSTVPILTSNRMKDRLKREQKKKHSDRVERKNKPEMEVENRKNMEIIWGGDRRNKKVEVLYPAFKDFGKDRPSYMNEMGGEAVVIYQRSDRHNYNHPRTGDGCQFEKISFSGSCETAVDLVQSKRSLSEPRQNSTREFYVARRRTRFQLDPYKKTSTQSDFQSAMDFIKQSNATGIRGFRNFEEMNNSVSRFVYNNPSQEYQKLENRKARYSIQPTVKKSKSSSDSSTVVGARLKQAAEKKLDLHKEMIRAEERSKKKFWESIERSLNYRCAVAEMFSSQSYLSPNESSKFFGNADSPAGRSTNIYVRESFMKKISSYQGFNRFISSKEYDFKNKSNTTSNSTYSQMKAVLDTFLIKEDEEIFLNSQLNESYISRTISDNMGQTEFTFDDFNNSVTLSASEMVTLMENNLCNSETHSKLELLMSKLSEEIRKCSNFIQTFNKSMTKKVAIRSLPKLSASDSEIELNKKGENKTSKKTIGSWLSSDPIVCPSLFYSASITSLKPAEKRQKKPKNKTFNENDTDSFDPTIIKDFNRSKQTDSTLSLLSYNNEPLEPNKKPTHVPKHKPTHVSGNSPTHVSGNSPTHVSGNSPTHVPSNSPTHAPSNSTTLVPSNSPTLVPSNSPTYVPKSSSATQQLNHKKQESSCCKDCKMLKERIIRLEKELGKIEKRMPLYPKECQESIKHSLLSLTGTSNTFLKRLKSCAKLKYLDSESRKLSKCNSKRSMSAPGPIVEKRVRKKLPSEPNNSDCQLNVGMEITMENVDPVTGKKLHPEANRDTQQEGKIQCRMFRNGEKPVLLMDTDFSYNPTTGMLFKNKKSHSTETRPGNLIIPKDSVIKKSPSAFDLMKTHKAQLHAYECHNTNVRSFDHDLVGKCHRDMSTQGSSCPITDVDMNSDIYLENESRSRGHVVHTANVSEVGTSPKSEDFLLEVSDSTDTRPEWKGSQKGHHIFWFNKNNNLKVKKLFSRIPVRKKTNPSSTNSKTDTVSRRSSLTSFDNFPPLSEYCFSSSHKNFLKNPDRSKRTLKCMNRIVKNPPGELSFMHKSTQTYEKGEKNFEPKNQTKQVEVQTTFETRHFGVQAAVKNQVEESQISPGPSGYQSDINEESESESQIHSLTDDSSKSNCQSEMTYCVSNRPMTVNVAIQADNPPKKRCETVSVGFQIDLPSEENLKYLNDLKIQKKVNMAIAELCFHLSQNDGPQRV